MSTKTLAIDLMDELAAIREGSCVWCMLHRPHPAYSRCSHNDHSMLKQVERSNRHQGHDLASTQNTAA